MTEVLSAKTMIIRHNVIYKNLIVYSILIILAIGGCLHRNRII